VERLVNGLKASPTSLAVPSAPGVESPQPTDSRGLLEAAIQAQAALLSPNERRVAEAILADPKQVVYETVSQLARRSGTSEATVIRCCYSLGLRGFQDLKARLAREAVDATEDGTLMVTEKDDAAMVLTKIIGSAAGALALARESVDLRAFERAAHAIAVADRVLFVGAGPSGLMAQYAGYRYMEVGGRAEAPPDSAVQHVAAALLSPEDVCLAISYAGSTREVLATVAAAKQAGALIIGLSSFFRSPLVKAADVAIVTGNREVSFHEQAMAARAAQFAVLDALIVAAALANPSRFATLRLTSARTALSHRV
jgi:DNA-binding MurR/RpiR family transcriptional regulator